MQHDDFLTGCANTLELSIKGQELLAQDLAQALRQFWRRVFPASGSTLARQPDLEGSARRTG